MRHGVSYRETKYGDRTSVDVVLSLRVSVYVSLLVCV